MIYQYKKLERLRSSKFTESFLKRENILFWNPFRNVKQNEDRSEFGQISKTLGTVTR